MLEAAQETGRTEITKEARAAICRSLPLPELEAKIEEIETAALIPRGERTSLLVQAWQEAVEDLLEDGVLDSTEEDRLDRFSKHFDLPSEELCKTAAFQKLVKAAVLREVLSGKIPERIALTGATLVNFQKNESVIWAFSDSKYLEDKTRRQFVGSSQGVSVRVMKGVYYRVGAFKGQPISYTERVHVDTGWLFVTSKNLYFVGPQKSVRIPYNKMLSFEPFFDGIGIVRDSASAKAQIFVTGDGWYTYNLVTNLAKL